MSQQDVDTVRGAYDAFNRGDIPSVLETYDAEIEWTEPGGGNAPAGTFRGRDSVAQDVFGAVPENFEEFSVDTDEFKDEGERIVVTGRFQGTAKGGATLDATFEHVLDMRGGKVVRFQNNVDEAAWAQGWSG
jgi:ketosteroid isomerase-like protein